MGYSELKIILYKNGVPLFRRLDTHNMKLICDWAGNYEQVEYDIKLSDDYLQVLHKFNPYGGFIDYIGEEHGDYVIIKPLIIAHTFEYDGKTYKYACINGGFSKDQLIDCPLVTLNDEVIYDERDMTDEQPKIYSTVTRFFGHYKEYAILRACNSFYVISPNGNAFYVCDVIGDEDAMKDVTYKVIDNKIVFKYPIASGDEVKLVETVYDIDEVVKECEQNEQKSRSEND